jgi:hypothetical protein
VVLNQRETEIELSRRIEAGESLSDCVTWLATTGASFREAIYILENLGLDVETSEAALRADPTWSEMIRLADDPSGSG